MDDAVEGEGPWRLVALGLAIVAVIGWGLLAWTYTQSSSDETLLRDRLTKVQGERDGLDSELKKQRDANGSLADVAAKRDGAEAETSRAIAAAQVATKARDAAAADLLAMQTQSKSLADAQAQLKSAIADLGTQRDRAAADVDAARQQGDTLKQAFAKASDQLAQKNSELADLNDKVQKARGEKSAQDAAQAEANKTLAQAQADMKTLLGQRTDTEKAVAELTTQNARQTQAKAELEQQVSGLQQQNAAATSDLARLQGQVAEAKATLDRLDREAAAQKAAPQPAPGADATAPAQQPAAPALPAEPATP